ncbi:unnamed protein product [Medioppia subpectinata]|nr:unnamed protein product [Medioppia subpectinata]CAG2104486.1 unnamed protein product [Medioppia subpectinata]
MILIDYDHFKIAINGSHFTEFRYRIPLQRITHLAIDGDVAIASITYEGTSQPAYAPPPPSAPHIPPYPMSGAQQSMPAYAPSYATGAPYQSQPYASPNAPVYPTGGYPQASYPTAGYPNPGYPTPGYPHSPSGQNKGILGGALGGTLGGLAATAAASGIGSAILGKTMGKHHKNKHSSPIPIAGLAAGAGAAALGAAVLTGHHPFKKAKKMFKHKGFKHKWHKPKFGKWKHKGWSSGSSSEEE